MSRKRKKPKAKVKAVIKTKPRQNRERQSAQVPLTRPLKAIILHSWKAITILSLLVGFTGLFVFVPRLTVSPLNTMNPSDPFAIPFTVSNEGILSVYNIQFDCVLNDVLLNTNDSKGISFKDSSVGEAQPMTSVLEASQKTTKSCLLGFPNTKANSRVDVAISISYQPYFLIPYRGRKSFRFIMKQDSNGQWQPQPMAK